MRIISKFRDYYDSAQGYGIDPNLVYERRTRRVVLPAHAWNETDAYKFASKAPKRERWDIQGQLLLFCGQAFPVWQCGDEWHFDSVGVRSYLASKQSRSEEQFCDWPDMIEFDSNAKYELHLNDIRRVLYVNQTDIEGFISDVSGKQIGFDLHLQLRSPAVLIRVHRDSDVSVIIDPELSKLGFAAIKDAFTAFQEIATFLGNELAQPDIAPQTVGDDKTIAQSKGFDEQSFRTAAPGQKKINRKANRARKRGDD